MTPSWPWTNRRAYRRLSGGQRCGHQRLYLLASPSALEERLDRQPREEPHGGASQPRRAGLDVVANQRICVVLGPINVAFGRQTYSVGPGRNVLIEEAAHATGQCGT